ncbi:uncharacterized protein METZ01_LOCUS20166 [marine metagenome]|uniref:Uncharacterized protein n=1 Tax=marine metagenome TaxID=408172 RepID=A0A381PJX7_9ZZZZ
MRADDRVHRIGVRQIRQSSVVIVLGVADGVAEPSPNSMASRVR